MELRHLLMRSGSTKHFISRISKISRSTLDYIDTKGAQYPTVSKLALTCGFSTEEFEGIRKLSDCTFTQIHLNPWTPPSLCEPLIAWKKSGLSKERFSTGLVWPEELSWPEQVLLRIATDGLSWPEGISRADRGTLREVFNA